MTDFAVTLVQERLRPYVWRRIEAALDALRSGRALYLRDGYPI
jgi:hypothetical protein